MGSDEAFCLKWNDFQGSISSSLGALRTTSDLLDVTVQCGVESLQCHRLVLSACSDWFKAVFRALPAVTQHPVIVLWEATARDMALLLDFMYNGEVNVKQENLNSFLALAEKLSVRGLTQGQGGGGGGGEKERDRHKEPVKQQAPVHSSTPLRRQEDRGESVKRQRVEHRAPDHRGQQQHQQEVEEVAVVKQEISREVEPVEQVVEEYGNYQDGGEVAQYEGDNMYDSYYDEGGQADYGQLDNSQQMASKDFPRRGGDCPICHKNTANIRRHVQDVHMTGVFPCPFCGKVFGSKNKQGSHTSRFCSKVFKDTTLLGTVGTSTSSASATVSISEAMAPPATSVIVLPQKLFSSSGASGTNVKK